MKRLLEPFNSAVAKQSKRNLSFYDNLTGLMPDSGPFYNDATMTNNATIPELLTISDEPAPSDVKDCRSSKDKIPLSPIPSLFPSSPPGNVINDAIPIEAVVPETIPPVIKSIVMDTDSVSQECVTPVLPPDFLQLGNNILFGANIFMDAIKIHIRQFKQGEHNTVLYPTKIGMTMSFEAFNVFREKVRF